MKLQIIILISISMGVVMLLNGTFTFMYLNLPRIDNVPGGYSNHMCSVLLQRFRDDEIELAKKEGYINFRRSYVTLSRGTPRSFYVATHDKGIDWIRAGIMEYHYYYETKLSEMIVKLFQRKKEEEKESIFLDVGGKMHLFLYDE